MNKRNKYTKHSKVACAVEIKLAGKVRFKLDLEGKA